MIKIVNIYLIKSFINTFIFAIVALCLIFMIVNLMENLDDFLDQNTGFWIIARYYLYFFPEIIKLMTPVAVLLSTLFTVGKFSTNNEITAMKSGGISLYRIMLPFVFVAVLISLGHLYFNGWLVPKAVTIKIGIEQKYLKKGMGSGQIFNIYFRDTPLTNVTMHYYDSDSKFGNAIAVETYDNEKKPRLLRRLEANKLKWDDKNKRWMAVQGLERIYSPLGTMIKTFDSCEVKIGITHSQLVELKKSSAEMNYDQHKSYIALVKHGGKDVRQQLIEYYGDYAFPFSNLIVVLFGVPFASVRKKGGIAIQIGAALVVSFLYIIFTKVGQTIGFYSNLDPIFTGWMANIIFFLGAMVVLFKTRT
jgi:lipopolysaccharide export system permease protein